jgi:hypothetical protein
MHLSTTHLGSATVLLPVGSHRLLTNPAGTSSIQQVGRALITFTAWTDAALSPGDRGHVDAWNSP